MRIDWCGTQMPTVEVVGDLDLIPGCSILQYIIQHSILSILYQVSGQSHTAYESIHQEDASNRLIQMQLHRPPFGSVPIAASS